MSPARTTRSSRRVAGFFFLLLVTAMLAFGLHARLQQYLPEAALHPAPLALYDQDAQSSKLLCASLGQIVRHTAAPVLVSMNPMPQPVKVLIVRRDRQVSKDVPLALPSYHVPLFFRPPPTLHS